MLKIVKTGGILAVLLLGSPGGFAQQPTAVVGAPPGVLAKLVEDLGPLFRAQRGLAVRVVPTSGRGVEGVEIVLVSARPGLPEDNAQTVFFGDGILVGSKSDRARVRGQRDMKAAFRWIASARALYVSSSPAMGLREIELRLWEEAGVNVRARSTWYVEAVGDENAVFSKAAQLGAYTLIQRATWASQDNRRGLEIIAEGDPALRTGYASVLGRAASREAKAWHEWLGSEDGQKAISEWRFNGIKVFVPVNQKGPAPPRT